MALAANSVKQTFPIVYHSLEQVLKTLTISEVGKSVEVKELLEIGAKYGILDRNTFAPARHRQSASAMQNATRDRDVNSTSEKPNSSRFKPFIAVEGLDGTGKSHVSKALSSRLNLDLRGTPPDYIKHLKGFFNEQREPVKRAYFAFGNYLAAEEIASSKTKIGNVIDRYWHSTAAYALAHELTSNLRTTVNHTDFVWPSDLLRPDLVLFLVVSEEIRIERHAKRNTTNTKEEKMLANNGIFRENLIASYKQITGPTMLTLRVDEDIEVVKTNVCKKISELYPILDNSKL